MGGASYHNFKEKDSKLVGSPAAKKFSESLLKDITQQAIKEVGSNPRALKGNLRGKPAVEPRFMQGSWEDSTMIVPVDESITNADRYFKIITDFYKFSGEKHNARLNSDWLSRHYEGEQWSSLLETVSHAD